MKRCTTLLLLAGVFALAQAAPAPEAITIKFKPSGEGKTLEVVKQDTQSSRFKLTDRDGMVRGEANEVEMEVAEYTETVLKRPDSKKPATKLERAYTKAQIKKGDKTEDVGLGGKTVVIEEKDGKYTFAFKDGEEVTGPAAEALKKEFTKSTESADLETLLIPKRAVKTGEEWKLDMDALVKEFIKDGEFGADAAKSTGTGKLLKAYTRDGKQYGELHYKMEMALQSMGKGDSQVNFDDGAKFVLEMTVDGCIDGTSAAGTMKMKVIVKGTGTLDILPGSVFTLDTTSEMVRTDKEPAK